MSARTTIKNITKRLYLLQDLTHLIFPERCLSCDSELPQNQKHICSFCSESLSHTSFDTYKEATPMDQLFWGRVDIHSTYAHLFFEKNKSSQTILFSLKYRNNQAIGQYFGSEIGHRISNMNEFKTADVILSVPLHPKKEFIRGYNQSKALAEGLSSVLKIPHKNTIVKRQKYSGSQTKKSRFERWDNVQSAFQISDAISNYQHVIIVDDVITTGSTLESISSAIKEKSPETKISLVTLAIA